MKRKTFERFERMAQQMALPSDVVMGSIRVEMLSNRQALVFNHEGIVEYDETGVSINSKSHTIKICGKDLSVAAMNRTAMKVTGSIRSVEFI